TVKSSVTPKIKLLVDKFEIKPIKALEMPSSSVNKRHTVIPELICSSLNTNKKRKRCEEVLNDQPMDLSKNNCRSPEIKRRKSQENSPSTSKIFQHTALKSTEECTMNKETILASRKHKMILDLLGDNKVEMHEKSLLGKLSVELPASGSNPIGCTSNSSSQNQILMQTQTVLIKGLKQKKKKLFALLLKKPYQRQQFRGQQCSLHYFWRHHCEDMSYISDSPNELDDIEMNGGIKHKLTVSKETSVVDHLDKVNSKKSESAQDSQPSRTNENLPKLHKNHLQNGWEKIHHILDEVLKDTELSEMIEQEREVISAFKKLEDFPSKKTWTN
ncbi:hypothetical protein L9F63_021044, partial [Diploptera punctata]